MGLAAFLMLHGRQNNKTIVIHYLPQWLQLTENWIFNQVRYLPEEIESHIVCETTENVDQFRVPNIHVFSEASLYRRLWDKGLRRFRFRRHLGYLTHVAIQHRADILHSHFGNLAWINLYANRKWPMRHIVTFYGMDLSYLPALDPAWRQRYVELFAEVDLVLCEGPHMANCLAGLGCSTSKLQIHHLGVSLEEIAYRPRVWHKGEELRVLIAASFREKKGIPFALEALGQLQHSLPLRITIIGDSDGQPRSQTEKQRILSLLTRYNLESKTRLLGYQPRQALLETSYKHHVFLSPSVTAADGDTEGGAPITLIELAATGMPVVSTIHCDIPSVIQHGHSGLLAEERDVYGLVEHLLWLIENPQRWETMCANARRHVEAEYDATRQAQRLARIYREVIPA